MRVAAVAVLMLVLAFPAAGAQPPRRAALQLASLAPLVVRGNQFGPREAVVVTYEGTNARPLTVGVRAKQDGGFRAKFELRLDRCAAFTVRAAGLGGSRAVLQVEPACVQRGGGPPKRAPAIPRPPTD